MFLYNYYYYYCSEINEGHIIFRSISNCFSHFWKFKSDSSILYLLEHICGRQMQALIAFILVVSYSSDQSKSLHLLIQTAVFSHYKQSSGSSNKYCSVVCLYFLKACQSWIRTFSHSSDYPRLPLWAFSVFRFNLMLVLIPKCQSSFLPEQP